MRVVAVGVFGFAGAVTRYALGLVVGTAADGGFPWATLLVNVSGSLALGLVAGVASSRPGIPDAIALGLTVGFLGAYTTFSTFSLETLRLVERGDALLAAGYVGASVAAGLLAVFAGSAAAKAL